jgi:hypothetical protein
MTALEQATRIAWIGWGSFAQWTICAGCGEWHYCRSRGGHRYLCLDCFDQR